MHHQLLTVMQENMMFGEETKQKTNIFPNLTMGVWDSPSIVINMYIDMCAYLLASKMCVTPLYNVVYIVSTESFCIVIFIHVPVGSLFALLM